eukprot:CAMPEP_0203665632 /NCGR_PEP_ID=MMETSP0090-20130426/2813_1 /ASSEMBLY_ACC=CAM_ASM_001088 /TAXON_ID=426623 /ORGANISM="Chaetoceros affinis, Strain CCMP159" /LENGTH=621 /DNA_ID=CAMNT_0050529253 /DNA_START=273 /DNA_END=2135 /DNA_ORIENTATION=+
MSTTFNTIRKSLSLSTTTAATSSPSSSSLLSLEHTLAMVLSDGVLGQSKDQSSDKLRSQFRDSLSLSQSLQTPTRTTFHKTEICSDNSARPATAPTTTSSSSSSSRKKNPFSKKAVKDLLSTSLRTHCEKPLELVVETISIALFDAFQESYGSPSASASESSGGGSGNANDGITVKDMKNLTYTCSDLSFDPFTCTWMGKASYRCELVIKSSTSGSGSRRPSSSPSNPQQKVRNTYAGSFMFSVSCQTVKIAPPNSSPRRQQSLLSGNENNIQEEEEWSESSPTKTNTGIGMDIDIDNDAHYCIDIEAILGGDDDDDIRNEYDRYVLKVIAQTLTHIGYDVSRALSWLDLPEFPEGCKDVKFRTVYQLNAKIKSGAFATVCLGTHRATRRKVAIKCVHRKNLPPSDDIAIHSEVRILGSLRHEYICPIIDFFMEDDCYYIVMDLMEGGDVFDRIGQLEYYDESIARELCYKMLQGIAFCHEQNIAHCDLKPKNLLLKTKDDDSSVMLADFGFASDVFAPKTLTKQCGTPYFVAPEILLRNPYDQQADMWSVGVIIYCILSGQLPFTGKRHLDLFKAIIAGEFTFGDGWEEVSDEAKDLINGLLVTNPDQRYTAKDALGSKW